MSTKTDETSTALTMANILLDKELYIIDFDLRATKLIGLQKHHTGKNLLNISNELYLDSIKLENLLRLKTSNSPPQKAFTNDNGLNILLQLSSIIGPNSNKILTIIGTSDVDSNTSKLNHTLNSYSHMLNEYSYAVSHDLQAPLRHIIAYSKILFRKHKNSITNEAFDYIKLIHEAAMHMQQLMSGLLDCVRIRTHGNEYKLCDLDNALVKALKHLHSIIQNDNVAITYTQLPSLKLDETQITRVFTNLIENAIYFNNKAEKKISIDSQENENEWLICISDNGCGIQADLLEKIFLIFKHNPPNKASDSQGPKLGIGLTICKQIIERHGGKIWAKSVIDQGSQIFFTLPKNRINLET